VERPQLIKYAANAFLATKVTFINELAGCGEAARRRCPGSSPSASPRCAHRQPFPDCRPGFGGSCFPKDLVALIKSANDFGSPVEIVETVIRANDRHKQLMCERSRAALGGRLCGLPNRGARLAFKANTDDMRNSPALTIVAQFLAEGAEVQAYDPAAASRPPQLLPDVHLKDPSRML